MRCYILFQGFQGLCLLPPPPPQLPPPPTRRGRRRRHPNTVIPLNFLPPPRPCFPMSGGPWSSAIVVLFVPSEPTQPSSTQGPASLTGAYLASFDLIARIFLFALFLPLGVCVPRRYAAPPTMKAAGCLLLLRPLPDSGRRTMVCPSVPGRAPSCASRSLFASVCDAMCSLGAFTQTPLTSPPPPPHTHPLSLSQRWSCTLSRLLRDNVLGFDGRGLSNSKNSSVLCLAHALRLLSHMHQTEQTGDLHTRTQCTSRRVWQGRRWTWRLGKAAVPCRR